MKTFLPHFYFFLIACSLGNVFAANNFKLDDSQLNTYLGTKVGILNDSTHLIKVEDILKLKDEKFIFSKKRVPSFGYSEDSYWVKLEFDNRTSSKELYLQYEYPLMQNIEMFHYVDGELQSRQTTGKMYAFTKRKVKNHFFILPIVAPINSHNIIIYKLKSKGAVHIPIKIQNELSLLTASTLEYLGYGIYFGMIAVMVLYNFFLFLSTKEKSYLAYVFYIGSLGIVHFSLYGFSYQFLWPDMVWFNSVSVVFFVGVMLTFLNIFTRFYIPRRYYSKYLYYLLNVCLSLSLILSALSLVHYGAFAIRMTGLLASVTPFVILFIAINATLNGSRSGKYFLFSLLSFLVGIIIYAVRDLHFLPHTFFTEHAPIIGSSLEVIFLSLGLADRINSLKKDKMLVDIKNKEAGEKIKLMSELVEAEGKVSSIAKQVAHDIRSPLAALNMISKNLDIIPEETRVMLRGSVNRIEDIANNLLHDNKDEQLDVGVYLLGPIIEEIVSEKRTLIRSRMDVSIQYDSNNVYGAFASISKSDLKRILSNLINNSLDAFGDNKGKISVSLATSNHQVTITVSDDGMGIPQHMIEKLGNKGVSYGKEDNKGSGTGLGLYHAKTSMELWNGSFAIESTLGIGTNIILSFGAAEAPQWFIPELKLTNRNKLVIIDDDSSIHQIWDKRLEAIASSGELSIFHLSGEKNLSLWIENNSTDDTVFLCDYEFIGEKLNGLDLIEREKILNKSVLVTSRFEDNSIIQRCQDLGVRLLPKMMVETIPMVLETKVMSTSAVDLVHLDDDELIRMCWNMSAKKKDKHILSFSNASDLKKKLSTLSKETAFYIDSCLGEDALPGQDFAKELYNLGYENLYLSTGYEKEKFENMPWIKDVTGKAPPWDNIHV